MYICQKNKMNLLDHVIKKILSEPYKQYNHWFVDVEAECYGVYSNLSVMVKTHDEALKVKIGDTFLA